MVSGQNVFLKPAPMLNEAPLEKLGPAQVGLVFEQSAEKRVAGPVAAFKGWDLI